MNLLRPKVYLVAIAWIICTHIAVASNSVSTTRSSSVLTTPSSSVSTTRVSQRSNFAQWSRNKLFELNAAKNDAWTRYVHGDHAASINILKESLERVALNPDPYVVGALTVKAIERGPVLVAAVEEYISGEASSLKVLNHFLFKYYDFIFEVASKLDRPYFRGNYCYQHRGPCYGDVDKIEKLYIKFAFAQTRMVLRNFVIQDKHSSNVSPKGSPAAFLKALEYMSAWTAQDIEGTLYSQYYACRVEALWWLSDSLASYNAGGMSGYPNDIIAINRAYYQAKNLSYDVNRQCTSVVPSFPWSGGTGLVPTPGPYDPVPYPSWDWDGDWNGDGDYNDDWNGDFGDAPKTGKTYSLLEESQILKEGQVKSFPLRRSAYVKKIYISGEGVRNDARFNVFVNGEAKGTIYLPGKDPNYVVTIEASTDSIEFISDFGKARINSIHIVTEPSGYLF